jgi:K(+)-stimulated pyrophosphate-energized sodium pump
MWMNFDSFTFASGSSSLPRGARSEIGEIAATLDADPDLHLTIEGFTDNVESPTENLRMSQSRADSVKNALVAIGIAAGRITARGLGEKEPIADNATEEGRATNRRVSVTVTPQ